MAKYLITGSYTAEGAKALAKDGGSARKTAVAKLLASVGGKVESFYFAFGASDIYVTVDVPDTASAAALSLAVNKSGLVRITVVTLLTPEDIDAAAKKSVKYKPPGK